MICMVARTNGKYYYNKINTSNDKEYHNRNNTTNDINCDFCKKPGHPKMKDGKPFCFKYKKWLKKNNNINNNNTNNNNTNNNDNKDINGLFVTCVTFEEDKDDKNISSEQKDPMWLGDIGAHCHVRIANKDDIDATNLSVCM